MLDGVMLAVERQHMPAPMERRAADRTGGLRESVEEQVSRFAKCARYVAPEFRVARSAEEPTCSGRAARTRSRGGRVSPSYYVQVGVVPRTQIAPTHCR
jgi:glycolate oxidase